MEQNFKSSLESKQILLCVGSGGVGKTTTAAALGIAGAKLGRRVLVLTIDPAKRLANSLGLKTLGHEIQQVDLASLGIESGELHAMMLDQKSAFDDMVRAQSRDPEATLRILDNPIYQQISGTLAGAQEYAALTKLHDLSQQNAFDLIIVDTPPTAHALDFLDAPKKLAEAIDSPAIEWFRKINEDRGWSLVGTTGTYVLKKLAAFVGSQFLQDLSTFFIEFNDILGGFKARAEGVFQLLRKSDVGFVLVSNPEDMAVREALNFYGRLAEADMNFSGFVVNRIHVDRPSAATESEVVTALAATKHAEGASAETVLTVAKALMASHARLQKLAETDKASIARLEEKTGQDAFVTIPLFGRDVHELDALLKLSACLA